MALFSLAKDINKFCRKGRLNMRRYLNRELQFIQNHPLQFAFLGFITAIVFQITIGLLTDWLIFVDSERARYSGPTVGQQFGLIQIPLAGALGATLAFTAAAYVGESRAKSTLLLLVCSSPFVIMNVWSWAKDIQEDGYAPVLVTLYLPLILLDVILVLMLRRMIMISQASSCLVGRIGDRTMP